jgi:hypothetical protein
MSFEQKAINYAQQYSKELANAYPYLSYFAEVYASPNNAQYKPVNAQTVMIPSMSVSGARAVNRNSINGQFSRNFNVNYEPKQLGMYREWDTIVDKMDIVESNDVATIANATKTFNQFEKVPEMDAYAAMKIASFADEFGGVDATTLTSANILEKWDEYLAFMTDQRVNRDRVVAHVIPSIYKLLKEASGLTRFIEVTNGIRNVDRNVGKLDGVTIVETPSDMMQTLYDFTEGWVVDANATQINILFVDPLAIIAPIVYEVSMFTPASAATRGKDVYYESYYYDVFSLKNRGAGFFASKALPTLGALGVTSVAGSASGDTKIDVTGAMINSLGEAFNGLELYVAVDTNAVSLTYGSALPNGATWAKFVNGSDITAASGKVATIALVNKATGAVIAGGNATVVAKA